MKFQFNDGGRADAGFKGSTGDCVVRAIAIATDIPYKDVYDQVNAMAKQGEYARTGVSKMTTRKAMKHFGFDWIPTMKIGSGTTIHLRESEIPDGTIVVRLSKHLCAVKDKVIHDTHDPSRNGTRCVYGYWRKP